MAGIRFIYAESRLRGGNDFRRVQHAADQQQSHDNGQRDAVDGERLVREGGHELQEADDHHIADHERHDGGRDGRTPAREHSRIACGHILDRGNGFEDARAEHGRNGHQEAHAHCSLTGITHRTAEGDGAAGTGNARNQRQHLTDAEDQRPDVPSRYS